MSRRLRGGTGTEDGWRAGKLGMDRWLDRIIICNRDAKDGTYALVEVTGAVLCCNVL